MEVCGVVLLPVPLLMECALVKRDANFCVFCQLCVPHALEVVWSPSLVSLLVLACLADWLLFVIWVVGDCRDCRNGIHVSLHGHYKVQEDAIGHITVCSGDFDVSATANSVGNPCIPLVGV